MFISLLGVSHGMILTSFFPISPFSFIYGHFRLVSFGDVDDPLSLHHHLMLKSNQSDLSLSNQIQCL